MKDPLKQGLKQSEEVQLRNGPVSWSERSIKTRIETSQLANHYLIDVIVEVKDPLKQGLKQSDSLIITDDTIMLKWKIH